MTDLETLVLQILKIKTTVTRLDLLKALRLMVNISYNDYYDLLNDLENAGKIDAQRGTLHLATLAKPAAYSLPSFVSAIRTEAEYLKRGIDMPGVTNDSSSFFLKGQYVPMGYWFVRIGTQTYTMDHVIATTLLKPANFVPSSF